MVNLFLVDPKAVGHDGVALLSHRHARHVREVLKLQAGDSVRAGIKGINWHGPCRLVAVDSPSSTACGNEPLSLEMPRDALEALNRTRAAKAKRKERLAQPTPQLGQALP
eukprot:Polyplicarium_translucidae@DN2580_c0_g1_i3.p2